MSNQRLEFNVNEVFLAKRVLGRLIALEVKHTIGHCACDEKQIRRYQHQKHLTILFRSLFAQYFICIIQ